MYTLIVYDEMDLTCFECVTELIDPYYEDNSVYWSDGRLQEISVPFIIIEGKHEVSEGENVQDLIPLDIKDTLISQEKKQAQDYATTQSMINALLFDPKNSEQDTEINQMQLMLNTIMLGGF